MVDNLIFSDPRIILGKPCIVGTRITVELILEKLSAGEPIEQIVDSLPRLTQEGVLAAIDSAREALVIDCGTRIAFQGNS